MLLSQLHKTWAREEILKSLFLKAIAKARKFMMKSDLQPKLEEKEKLRQQGGDSTYFHLEYHDQNPPLRKIQDSFSRMVLNPVGKKTFNKIVLKCTWRQSTSGRSDICKPQSKESWRLVLHKKHS